MESALDAYCQSLEVCLEIEEISMAAGLLQNCALIVAALGFASQAAWLWGMADGVWQVAGVPRQYTLEYGPLEADKHDEQQRRAEVMTVLTNESYTTAYREGYDAARANWGEAVHMFLSKPLI